MIRGFDSTEYASSSTCFVAWPTGTVAGDLAIIQVCAAWDITPPAGWTQLYLLNATVWNAFVGWKVLNGADIALGGITVGAAGVFNMSSNVVAFAGSPTIRETVTSYTSSTHFVTSGSVTSGDVGIGFGSNRATGVMPTFSPGTMMSSDVIGAFPCSAYSIPMSTGANTVVTNMTSSPNNEGALVVVEDFGVSAQPIMLAIT